MSSADILGGAERSLQGLVQELSAHGHECILITPDGAPLQQWAIELGLAHEALDTNTLRQRNPFSVFKQIRNHRRFAKMLINKYGPGVFYSNTRLSFIAMAALPTRYVKLAHHRDIVSRRINRLLYPRIDLNIFVSQFNYGRSDSPVNGQVIYNAATFDCDLPPILADAPPAPLKLAMFARVTPYKGHRLALGACQLLAAAGVPYSLDIWGDAGTNPTEKALMQDLRATVEREGLTVAFPGFHSKPDEIMRDYHCVLNPSRDEPFGRIPVESFSLGVPSISHGSGGSLEIYSGLDAYAPYLFKDYTAEDLYQAIIDLKDRAKDPKSERDLLVQIRDDICRRFSISRHTNEIEAVIAQAAEPHSNLALQS